MVVFRFCVSIIDRRAGAEDVGFRRDDGMDLLVGPHIACVPFAVDGSSAIVGNLQVEVGPGAVMQEPVACRERTSVNSMGQMR